MQMNLDLSFPTFDDLKQNVTRKPVMQNTTSVSKVATLKAPETFRVAVYARVSTEMEGQDSSYEIQQKHYEKVIAKHPGWELAGIYHERVSGTHMENRGQLGMLLDECEKRRVDIVLTKSISRFARNTTDLLWMVRSMTSLGVRIVFEKENIDTGSGDGELILSLLATFAESEVRSISDNNKWAIRKRFENGSYKYARGSYGYDVEEGKLVINEEEAAIVREIFERFLNGEGSWVIAEDLNRRGISTKRSDDNWVSRKNGKEWSASSITRILRNESYMGDGLFQKSYHDENFAVKKNEGEMPMFLLEDHHEAIIDRETFGKAEALLAQRSKEFSLSTGRSVGIFSGRCICGKCGATLHRNQVRLSGRERIWWQCPLHKKDTGSCSMMPVLEEDLKNAFVTMLNKLHFADVILDLFIEKIRADWEEGNQEQIADLTDRIGKKKEELDRLASRAGIAHLGGGTAPFWQKKNQLMAEESQLWMEYEALRAPAISEAEALREFIKGWTGGSFPEDAFQEYVEKITAEERKVFTFHFKCGLTLTE